MKWISIFIAAINWSLKTFEVKIKYFYGTGITNMKGSGIENSQDEHQSLLSLN